MDTTHPAVEHFVKEIDDLKTQIEERDQSIRFLESKVAAIDRESIVVERYTIPKGQHLVGDLQNMYPLPPPISLNFSFAGVNSPKASEIQTGFKKKENSKQ